MSFLQTLAVAITTLISSIPLHDLEYIRTLTTKVIDGIGVIANEYSVYEKHDEFPPQKMPEEFDFVIVGASPSGSVIANRLSEIEGWNVLLLEAGGTPSFLPEIPLADITFYSTVYNWGTHAEQQPSFCFGCLNNKTAQLGHGKVLGGGSIINFMIFNRGNKMDYDTWEAMGNSGWSYKDVLQYFLKLEDANVAVNDSGYRSKGGPLGVSDISFRTELTNVFVDAAQEAGFPYVDYNGKEQIGVSYIQATLRNGLRSEAENSYLRPVRHKRNLKIRTGAHVTKILVRPNSKEAYGVEYKKNGVMYKVLARKEVILSAGGLNSPQVLMLSGVGPKDHLEEMGISVIKDLPVGETLYDHVAFIGAPFLVDQHIGLEPIKAALDPKTYVDFILHRKGVIASSALEAVAYLQTNLTDLQSTWPDIELLFVPATAAADFGIFLKPMLNINDEIYNAIYKPLAGKPSFMFGKYTVNYFSDLDNLDVKRLIVAIRAVQKIVNQPALKRFGAKMLSTPFPGCGHIDFDSEAYWECAIRTIPSTMWHQQSTCRMGPKTDKEAVVDARLKVHGIKNLRVADVSIFPRPVSGHTVGPAYMIGEKAADMIKEDWKMASN